MVRKAVKNTINSNKYISIIHIVNRYLAICYNLIGIFILYDKVSSSARQPSERAERRWVCKSMDENVLAEKFGGQT